MDINFSTLLPWSELCILLEEARKCSTLEGDYVEIGVYRGGSALVISSVKKNKTLHLFDTFEGVPWNDPLFESGKKGDYRAPLEEVKNNLSQCPNIVFHPGILYDTLVEISTLKIAFAHIDVDLYAPILESLAFLWPRMVKGGVILLHDFQAKSTQKALGIFAHIMEPIKLGGAYGKVVKP